MPVVVQKCGRETFIPFCLYFAGEVIKPDTFKCIAEEGMPFHGRPFQKGNLYIHFQVVFPDRIDPSIVSFLGLA